MPVQQALQLFLWPNSLLKEVGNTLNTWKFFFIKCVFLGGLKNMTLPFQISNQMFSWKNVTLLVFGKKYRNLVLFDKSKH